MKNYLTKTLCIVSSIATTLSVFADNPISAAKASLEDHGITFSGEYQIEGSTVFDGGIKEDSSYRNILTTDLSLDLDKMIGLPGGTAFIQYLHVGAEHGGTADSGDIQVYSNIENSETLDVIYELWYEQVLFDDFFRVKVGKVDVNTEFNYVDAAGNFSNSSAGFDPTIFTFPSYPNPTTSVNAFVTLNKAENLEFVIGYGFYDGAASADGISLGNRGPSSFFNDDLSDDYFHIVEGSLTWNKFGRMGPGRMAVTGWHHTGEFDKFSGGKEKGVEGFNLTIEQQVLNYRESGDHGLYLFAQYGLSDYEVSAIGQHIGFGLVSEGTFRFRGSDSMGVYFSYVDLSDEAGAGFVDDEFVIDAYYRIGVCENFFVQPELQYIVNPSGSNTVDDAIVGSIRAGVSF
jgi:porin